jgi:hypothetical protein
MTLKYESIEPFLWDHVLYTPLRVSARHIRMLGVAYTFKSGLDFEIEVAGRDNLYSSNQRLSARPYGTGAVPAQVWIRTTAVFRKKDSTPGSNRRVMGTFPRDQRRQRHNSRKGY